MPSVVALTPSGVTSPVYHLDAQDINGNGSSLDNPANNTAITDWIDEFGLGHTGSQLDTTKQPIYRTNQINTMPALSFNGTGHILEMADASDVTSGISFAEKSFAFMIRTGTDVLTHQVIYEQGIRSKGYSLQIIAGELYFGVWNTDFWIGPDDYKILNLGSLTANTNYRVIIRSSNLSGIQGYINGLMTGSGTGLATMTTHGGCTFDTGFDCGIFSTGSSIGIGATENETIRLSDRAQIISPYQTNFYGGLIGEIMQWNVYLTNTEVTGIDDYLKLHWNYDTTPPYITSENAGSGTIVPKGTFTYTIGYTDTGSSVNPAGVALRIYSWNSGSQIWNSTDLAPTYTSSQSITSTTGSWNLANIPYGKYRFDRVVTDLEGNTATYPSLLYIDAVTWTISTPTYDIGGAPQDITTFGSGEMIVTIQTIGSAFTLDMMRNTDLTSSGQSIAAFSGSHGWGYELYNGTAYSGTITAHDTNQLLSNIARNPHPDGALRTYTYRVKYGVLPVVNDVAGDYIGTIRYRVNFTF